MTASVMCMEHKMPLVVFGLNERKVLSILITEISTEQE